jgi:branched-chain amino acid aminotransferase
MASGLASIDGEITPLAQAMIPVSDPGLVRGDGVFEALRIYGGQPFAIDEHLARMQRSADGLRLEIDTAAFRDDVAALLERRADGDEVLRLIATRGGRRIAFFEEVPRLPELFSLGRVTYSPVRVLDGVKSLSYAANVLATRLAQERGFDEALLVTPHDRVLECPTSSFFAVIGGELRTPPLSEHILDSITRRVVLAVAEVSEASITVTELDGAEEAFIASSVREIAGVRRIEGRELTAPGPRTSELAELVAERIASGAPV